MIKITLEIPGTSKDAETMYNKASFLTMKQLRKILKGSFIHMRECHVDRIEVRGRPDMRQTNEVNVTYFVSKVKSLEHGK